MQAFIVLVAAATVGQYGGGGGGTNYGDWTASADGTVVPWVPAVGQRIPNANGFQCDWTTTGGPPGGVQSTGVFQYRKKPVPGEPGPTWVDTSTTIGIGFSQNTSTNGTTKTQFALPTTGEYEVRVAFQVPVQKGLSGPGQPVDWKTIYTDAVTVNSLHP